MADLNASIKTAEQAVSEATKAKKTLEDEIIDAQPSDSQFGLVRDRYRAADKAYQDARKAVLTSEDFTTRLAAAKESDDPAPAVLALKKEFDAMPEIAGPADQVAGHQGDLRSVADQTLGGRSQVG